MEKNHILKPYNDDEYKIWLLIAVLLTFSPFLVENTQKWYVYVCWGICVVLFWVVAIKELFTHFTEVSVSEDGIGIRRGKHDVVTFQHWNACSTAYILDVSWTDADHTGFLKKRYASFYFVLAIDEISDSELQKLVSVMPGSKHCGKVRGCIVFRTNKEHNAVIRQCIGDQIPLVEMKVNAEGDFTRI